MKCRVILESEVFGVEYFYYDTKKEANAGMSRLRKSCREHKKDDGISRKVYLDDDYEESEEIELNSIDTFNW